MNQSNTKISFLIESEKWVAEKNSYMNIPAELKSFFPDDCFIARGTGKENSALLLERGIDIQYEGNSALVKCFMELRDSGKFRPSSRGHIKNFYAQTGASLNDAIEFRKSGERVFLVSLVKPRG